MSVRSRFESLARATAGAMVLALASFSGAQAFVGERVVSPGGIEAWLVSSAEIPLISVNFSFEGGSSLDPEGKEGVAELVSYMLDEGAGDMDSRAFQSALNTNSIFMRFSAGLDEFGGSLYTLSANRDLAFSLLNKALTAPRFDEEPLGRMRAALLVQLRDAMRDPWSIASRAWWATAYPDHPYGRPIQGTEQSVLAIARADLQEFARTRFARDNLVIGVVGDITAEELGPLLDETFGALPEHATPWAVPDVEMQGRGEIVLVEIDLPQTNFLFGQPGPVTRSEAFHAVNVVNRVLGGGSFSGWLYREIRERRGLTYGVSTWLHGLEHTGLIMGSTSTVNARAGETLQILFEQWEKMAAEGPSAAEVEEARLYINGSYPLRYDDTASIASALRGWQQLDLPPDYYHVRHALVDAVTPEIALETARQWYNVEDLLVVVVGRPVGITPTRVASDQMKAMIGLPEEEDETDQ
ncbi:MAG: M16 family metallopeptidase [Alphaproteobacteria bacterium]